MLFNKKQKYLVILISAILLSACQPKAKNEVSEDAAASEVQVEQLTLKGTINRVPVQLPECKGNNCPKFVVENLQTNFPFIDKIINKAIVTNLAKTLELTSLISDDENADAGEKEDAKNTQSNTAQPVPEVKDKKQADATPLTAQQKLEQQVQQSADAFLALDQQLKKINVNHQINILVKPSILQANPPIATVVLNSSSYLGGAHGSALQKYFNFDLEKEKQITLNDLILPNKKEELKKQAHEIFLQWIIDSKLADNPKEYEQAWPFKMTDNFLLGQQGLILQYNEYEIAPYAEGLPRLVIPFDRLKDILRPEYLPQPVDTTATSEPKT